MLDAVFEGVELTSHRGEVGGSAINDMSASIDTSGDGLGYGSEVINGGK